MPNYRRIYVPGGTYFFTVVTHRRRRLFESATNRELLGKVIRKCQVQKPFEMNAVVLLPDHLHTIWTLPTGDDDYSTRWSIIKRLFTSGFLSSGGKDNRISVSKQRERRRGVWQRRFWAHLITGEEDFEAHFDYIHFNPVKHKLVECPADWEASSFHRWVKGGVYPVDWGCGGGTPRTIFNSDQDYGEVD